MKKLFFLWILCFFSCSSENTDSETPNEPDDEIVVVEEESEENPPKEEQEPDIPFNVSVFTLTDGVTNEFEIVKGELTDVNNTLNLTESLDLPDSYRFQSEGSKFTVWSFSNGPVWVYDVKTKEQNFYSDYFDLGDDFFISSPCTIPTGDNILTFFQTEDDPEIGRYYQTEIYDTQSEESFNVDLPYSSVNCLADKKIGSSNFLMYFYEEENDSFWGIIDVIKKQYLTSIEYSSSPFAFTDKEIIFFDVASNRLMIYDLDVMDYTQTTNITRSSDDLSSTVLLGFEPSNKIKTYFQEKKMLFYNGDGSISQTGNVSELYGPSILDIATGELQIFSSLKIYESYSATSEERDNLEILQSEIDLASNVIVLTYKDLTYSPSPYGVLFFDFELNLLKNIELGNNQPIEMIKYLQD